MFNEYREQKKHGMIGFPIQLYSVSSSYPQYVMPIHLHNEIEIVRVLSGKLNLYIDNVKYTMHKDDFAFINCNFLHRGEPIDAEYECVVFDLGMICKKSSKLYSDYISPLLSGDYNIEPFGYKNNPSICNIVSKLFSVLKTEAPFYEFSTVSILINILEMLYKSEKISKKKSPKSSLTQKHMIADIIDWIDNNYTEKINLQILSKRACVTPNYLCRIFKEYTKQTPIDYVNSIRIENVCNDIKNGNKTITEAASDNGFNDICYFCKVFKKKKGVSAKKYLYNLKQSAED